MSMPRADAESREFFESALPDDPRVRSRQMVGSVAGFVNGNMFIGLHGSALFVRLFEEDRAELLMEDGASVLEPMKGRSMKEYVLVPATWRQQPEKIGGWVSRSLEWVGLMPEKKPKKKSR